MIPHHTALWQLSAQRRCDSKQRSLLSAFIIDARLEQMQFGPYTA
jgi:hypothetical protein